MTNSVMSAEAKLRNNLQPIAPMSSHAIANAMLAVVLFLCVYDYNSINVVNAKPFVSCKSSNYFYCAIVFG